ncbi:MAG TPA: hypothetical protein VFB80_03515, partial [Pirellulaceae bacterium]|nr:hypothetical protein [Pirellulaceae bacterium]
MRRTNRYLLSALLLLATAATAHAQPTGYIISFAHYVDGISYGSGFYPGQALSVDQDSSVYNQFYRVYFEAVAGVYRSRPYSGVHTI